MKIVVGSKNPVKINAAKQAITQVLSLADIDCVGIDSPSGVPDQPMNSHETQLGALNRIKYCQQHIDADYYVAIEGGVELFEYGPATFAYIAITDGKYRSIGRSSMMPLPPKVFQALEKGEELGTVMDKLFDTKNVKQKQGAIGLLTNGLATRESIYTQAIILAMAPFINSNLF
ncbi:inosine/xanthosine triphosphatase [Paraglaciecola sp.]|uniref:inosine/xanthosine triphosphatase n=1 Tax=Paraglaciecola sp. TaxID=1920173 RepID=UPI003EFA3D47